MSVCVVDLKEIALCQAHIHPLNQRDLHFTDYLCLASAGNGQLKGNVSLDENRVRY